METWLNAGLLGFIEGVTEFLPVSSTGHLLLMDELLDFKGPSGNVFEIVIQFGAILAVVAVFFQRLWNVLVTAPSSPESRRFIFAVILSFIPAMVLGAFAHGFIKSVLFNPYVVSVSLVVGGFIMIWIEKHAPVPNVNAIETMPLKTALYIGFFQCLAMIPGVSRSGATIMGALMLKVDRKVAAEFSFFLAIPTMAAATVYDLYKNAPDLTKNDSIIIVIGLVVAFFSALFVVRKFVEFVGRHGFTPFAWYRIGLGSVSLAALLLLK
ncbi:MAG: undecaprenyl-diphosphate phosphatase [Alphaproteobacteria bacterium]|nr:undecaprenyl-diphosphate phosphatase [Alphaproteobacteria bacterium]